MRLFSVLALTVALVPASAGAQEPKIQLSFAPDSHVASRAVALGESFHIYVRNVGASFNYTMIVFDLSLDLDGPLGLISTTGGAPIYYLCDFPPWTWCLSTLTPDGDDILCDDAANYPILADTFLFASQTEPVPTDTVICIEGQPHGGWLGPVDGPAYADCDYQNQAISLDGGIGGPDGLGCIVLNPSTVVGASVTWSALKATY